MRNNIIQFRVNFQFYKNVTPFCSGVDTNRFQRSRNSFDVKRNGYEKTNGA